MHKKFKKCFFTKINNFNNFTDINDIYGSMDKTILKINDNQLKILGSLSNNSSEKFNIHSELNIQDFTIFNDKDNDILFTIEN